MNNTIVRCTGISKQFGKTAAVQDLDLELEEGRFLALLGPSGCGKTTLLRLIAGLEQPDSGTIEIGNRLVYGPGASVPPERRRAGFVFQDYALFPHLDVAANIAYGLAKTANKTKRVNDMLAMVGLEGLGRRMVHELSGGQQQRVALARALAPQPAIMLLDEPFSNLDADLRARVRLEVKDVLSCAGVTVIFVTHDQEEAMLMGDRIGVMNAGRLEQIDVPEIVFHRPATTFVAQFVGTADFLDGKVSGRTVLTELGPLPLYVDLPEGRAVTVMVRPDFVNLHPSPEGTAVILDRVFQGIHYLYTVKLPSGKTIRALQHHDHAYRVGRRVALRLNAGHRVAYFVDGKQAGGSVLGGADAESGDEMEGHDEGVHLPLRGEHQ